MSILVVMEYMPWDEFDDDITIVRGVLGEDVFSYSLFTLRIPFCFRG